MRRPTVRIRTLMLLVIIAALAVAMIAQRIRSERREAALHRALDLAARDIAELGNQRVARWSDIQAGRLSDAAEAYGVDPEIMEAVAGQIAVSDLGLDRSEVLEDLLAIAEGLPRPVELSDATAAYVVNRRDRKLNRVDAVRSVREQLATDAALKKAVAK